MTNEQIEIEIKHLASKEDLANLRAATKEDFANLRADTKEDLANLRVELKQGLANLRAELHEALSVQLKWIIGLLIAQSGLLIAILHR